jgi:pimeloyl-ACP methyl ester carboxylesterase
MGLALSYLPLGAIPTALAQVKARPAIDPSLAACASTKDSVSLPDGRTIHMVCMGHGRPTVILTPGSSGWSVNWHAVQPAVAAKTRVCAWDRAGQGLSTGVPQPQAIDQATTDLQAALRAGRIAGPWVVVGVSMGGLDSLLLADREPSNVAGMVLVDPSFPDQSRRLQRSAPDVLAWGDAHPPPFVAFLQKCIAALRTGTLRPDGADRDGCLRQQFPPSFPPELSAALEKARAEATPEAIASAIEGMHSEPSATIAIKPGRNYGSMPLIVLTAGINEGGPDLPSDLKAKVPLVAAEWRRANQELSILSKRGVYRLVPDSSHDIPGDKPQAVIEAIDEVVDQVRASVGR